MKTKLNLGCGSDIKPDYINLDFEKFSGVDVVADLNKLPWNFKDNSFSDILMSNILEHLDNPFQTMKEIHRISKNNALIKIKTPHFSSNNVWGDIQHKRGFNTETFKNANLSNLFQIISQKISFPHIRFFMMPLANIFPVFYEKHLAYIFPAVDLIIELRVKK